MSFIDLFTTGLLRRRLHRQFLPITCCYFGPTDSLYHGACSYIRIRSGEQSKFVVFKLYLLTGTHTYYV